MKWIKGSGLVVFWIVTAILGSLPQPATAALISLWSFDTAPTSSPINPTIGSGSLTVLSGTFGSTAGTTVNDPRTSPNASSAMNFTAAGSFTLQVSGSGLSGFQLSYAGQKAGGSGDQTWAWSTDNSTWSSTGITQPKLGPSWGTVSVDFSGVSSLNNASAIYFRNTFTTANALDNFQVNAVPEPTHIALAVFGFGAVGIGFGRKAWARVRAKLR